MEQKDNKYEMWHKDPANWKFGIFYYNPEDDRLFPPKRLRYLGWTVNFANPLSILMFVAILAFALLLLLGSLGHVS